MLQITGFQAGGGGQNKTQQITGFQPVGEIKDKVEYEVIGNYTCRIQVFRLGDELRSDRL